MYKHCGGAMYISPQPHPRTFVACETSSPDRALKEQAQKPAPFLWLAVILLPERPSSLAGTSPIPSAPPYQSPHS